jgi:RPA family protein
MSTQQETQRRQVACKLKVSDIMQSEYVKNSGWEPNFILTPYGKASRVNIIGFVVSKEGSDEKSQTLVVDDGTGSMTLRLFEAIKVGDLNLGDLVLVVGRPREWNGQKYVVPEIVKKVDDKAWLTVWHMETDLKDRQDVPKPIPQQTVIAEAESSIGPSQLVLETVQGLDRGDGANIDEVIRKCGIKNAEDIITSLIEEGELFQIGPGRIKVLE